MRAHLMLSWNRDFSSTYAEQPEVSDQVLTVSLLLLLFIRLALIRFYDSTLTG